MRSKNLLALFIGTLMLLTSLFFTAHAEDPYPIHLPIVIGSGSDTTTTPTSTPTTTPTRGTLSISGYVQKGPFIQGTEITVRELNNSLVPTGRTFTGVIDDNTGGFTVNGDLVYPYIELSANGFYFNEISGALSNAPITLLALVDTQDTTIATLQTQVDTQDAVIVELTASLVNLTT